MNHSHISFVDNDGTFYSASVETQLDLFTTAGIDEMALEPGSRLDQDSQSNFNIILLKSYHACSVSLQL